MDKFMKGTKLKVRFKEIGGNLSIEDLWTLGYDDLDRLAKAYDKQIKESSQESFVKKTTKVNPLVQLKFDIVKGVIDARLAADERAEKLADRKKNNARIMELISNKQDKALEEKSLEELQALLVVGDDDIEEEG